MAERYFPSMESVASLPEIEKTKTEDREDGERGSEAFMSRVRRLAEKASLSVALGTVLFSMGKQADANPDLFPYDLQTTGQLVPRSPQGMDGNAPHRVAEMTGSATQKLITNRLETSWSFQGNIYDGTHLRINPETLLMPGELVRKEDECFVAQEGFNLPMHYSRWFDQARSLKGEEDRERMHAYLKSEVLRILNDHITGLGLEHNNHDQLVATFGEDRNPHPTKISDIRFTGFAGPTGPATNGPESAMPGHIDQENLVLGKERAIEGAQMFSEVLHDPDVVALCQRHGIDEKELDSVWEKGRAGAKGYEDQFSHDELAAILAVAAAHRYEGTEAEKVFSVDYNYDRSGRSYDEQGRDAVSKFTPAEEKLLNGIIGSKRRAEVTVTYDGGEERTLIIPLPLLLLLPLLRFRRRSADITRPNPFRGRRNFISRKHFGDSSDPELVRREAEPLPEKPDSPIEFSSEYTDIKPAEDILSETRNILADDLYMYYGHPDNERGGLDYEDLICNAEASLPEFDHREDAEDYLTGEIIQRWRILDTANRAAALRRENGNLPEGWDAGLAYEYNDRQITYAQLHAKMLFTMIDAKQRDDRWRKRYGWESVEHQPDREGSVYRDYLNEFTEMFDLEEYGSVGELKDPANVLADRYRQLTERMQKADASAYRERSLLQAWYEGRPLEK